MIGKLTLLEFKMTLNKKMAYTLEELEKIEKKISGFEGECDCDWSGDCFWHSSFNSSDFERMYATFKFGIK